MKRLFFAALTAIVAVGGAYAQTATTWYSFGATTPTYICPTGQGSCYTAGYPDSGNPTVYPNPAPNQTGGVLLSTRPFPL